MGLFSQDSSASKKYIEEDGIEGWVGFACSRWFTCWLSWSLSCHHCGYNLHAMYFWIPTCMHLELVSIGVCSLWTMRGCLPYSSCIFAGKICTMHRVKMGNFGFCLAILIQSLVYGWSASYLYYIISFLSWYLHWFHGLRRNKLIVYGKSF